MTLRNSLKKMNRVLTPYRAGVTTDGLKHNKYRSRCFGRGACNRRVGRLRHPRRVRLADRPDLSGDGHRQPDAAHERDRPRDPRRPQDRQGARRVVHRLGERTDATKRTAKVVVVAASTLESARLLLLSKSGTHPNGIGNSSGHVGHNFCEHVMGPGVTGLVKERIGKPKTIDDGRPGGFYVPRFRNLSEKHPSFIRALRLRGQRRQPDVPGQRPRDARDSARATRRPSATTPGAYISMGGFGEVLPRYENQVDLDPVRKDKWGIPVLRFNYKFGDNEKKMCEDMADHGAGDVRRGRASRSSTSIGRCSPRAGRSTSSGRRAWARTRRRRC